MFDSPWNFLLSAAFIFTGLVHFCAFMRRRHNQQGTGSNRLTNDNLVDLNHSVMSLAMLLMVWLVAGDIANWIQMAIFAIFGALILARACQTQPQTQRINLLSHCVMDLAMIWMLAAMPLLMTHTGMNSMHMTHDMMQHSANTGMSMSPIGWATWVNAIFIALSVVIALWWLTRLAAAPVYRSHGVRHATMAAGMAAMLILMHT